MASLLSGLGSLASDIKWFSSSERPAPSSSSPAAPPDSSSYSDPYGSGPLLAAGSLRQGLESTREDNLRNRLLRGSREIHSQAMQDKFLRALTGSSMICAQGYNKYLSNLYVIHSALERAQEILKERPGMSHFIFPELWRSQAIQGDKAVWAVVDKEHPPEAVSTTYTEALVEKARTAPAEVLGAMYSLYGTLFHGGQRIKAHAFEQFKMHRDLLFSEKQEENAEIFDDSNPCLGVMLFCFSFENPRAFMTEKWHKHLNELPEKTGISLDELHSQMLTGATEAISTVLAFIASANC